MPGNSPDPVTDINLQIPEARRTADRINPKKAVPGHIIIKLKTTGKDDIVQAARVGESRSP